MDNDSSRLWWNPACRARVTVEIDANGFDRSDHPAEIELNFTHLLRQVNIDGAFSPRSLRVEEVDTQGNLIDGDVLSQFDAADGFEAAANALGNLSLQLKGKTRAGETRCFQVYFDIEGRPYPEAAFPVLVRVKEDVIDEKLRAYQIITQNATYFYQKIAGGFSSLLDREGRDWISYRPGGGSAGEFRGLPNLAPYGFHPGYENAVSHLISSGPLKACIFSETNDHQAACTWDIYPHHATMTLLRKGSEPYWFLYEGTPGGKLDPRKDYLVHANGRRRPLSEVWDEVLPDPEWLYFGSSRTKRVLYLVHHETDDQVDSYWPMQGNMTVFGFGRRSNGGHGHSCHMQAVPARFTIGFSEANDHPAVTQAVNAAFRPLGIQVRQPEVINGG